MKKIISFILLLCIVLSLTACGEVEITMQEIYDAGQTEALLKNHKSVYIRNEIDGELWRETYLTKDYTYDYIPSEESDWAELITDDSCYCYMDGGYLRYLPVSPDGISDFANYRAEHYAEVIFGVETLDDTIESVTKKNGRITVKSIGDQEALAEFGVTCAKFEYVLNARTREIISVKSNYTYNDGATFSSTTEISYDTKEPQTVKTFLDYHNQTENLRNITVVSNPGTVKEESKSIQAPKGLVIGLRYEKDDCTFEVYTNAACTESYDPYTGTDSDLTIYVKWTNK